MALQFFLAQARRQKLREEHRIRIQEELKHLEHRKEVACEQIKGTVAEEVRREKYGTRGSLFLGQTLWQGLDGIITGWSMCMPHPISLVAILSAVCYDGQPQAGGNNEVCFMQAGLGSQRTLGLRRDPEVN